MMNRIAQIVIGLTGCALIACSPANDPAPSQPDDAAAVEDVSPEVTANQELVGWLAADGAGETGAVFRSTPDAVEFSLNCSMADKNLRVRAKAPNPNNTPDSAEASLVLDTASFSGTAQKIKDRPEIELVLPVTTQLLKALSVAKSASLTQGRSSTQTGPDETHTLPDFAQSCSILTNVKLD